MSETTNTETTKCKRCNGSGMKGVKHGYLPCITCQGKGYRTADEIAADRQYAAEVRERQAVERVVLAFANTLPGDYRMAVIKLAGFLAIAVQDRANGKPIHADAALMVEQIRDRAGADLFAWIDAR